MDAYAHPVSAFMPSYEDSYNPINIPPRDANATPVAQRRERQQSSSGADSDGPATGTGSPSPATKKRKVMFVCEPCGTSYTEKRALARHRHTAQHRRNLGLPPSEKYSCTLCSKTFSREHDRVRHVNETHRGQKRAGRNKDTGDSDALPSVASAGQTPPSQRGFAAQYDPLYVDEQSSLAKENGGYGMGAWDMHCRDVEPYPAHEAFPRKSHEYLPFQSHVMPEGSTLSPASDRTAISYSTHSARNGSYSEGRSSRSWFAESSGSEDEDEATSRFKQGNQQPSNASTAADSAVDMAESGHDGYQSKPRSFASADFHPEQHDPQPQLKDTVDDELAAFGDLSLKPLPRATVVQGRGTATTIPAKQTSICAFCNVPFEDDCRILLAHLRTHLEALRGESSFSCDECKISFANKADLTSHQASAQSRRHCGFTFDHKHPCTGHHRPAGLHCPDLADADRFQLCVRLRHWEQSQLKAYMANIEELVAASNDRSSAVYSIEQLGQGSSRDSRSSYAPSVNTYASAPCDRTDGQMDVGGLQKRLKLKSLKSSAKWLPQKFRSGGAGPSTPGSDRPNNSSASQWQDPDAVRLLLGLGANINSHNAVHGSALASAARQGRMEVVQLLLRDGADPKESGGKYGSVLGAAAAGGHREIATLLLKHGADINYGKGSTGSPLSVASANGQMKMVQHLLERGADVNRAGGDEGSPIGFAIWYGRTSTASLLAQRGAALNINGGRHGNPLAAAVEAIARGRADLEMLNVLIYHGADVNSTRGSSNALCQASLHADLASMQLVIPILLERGANPNVSDSNGTAFEHAKRRYRHWAEKRSKKTDMDVSENVEEITGNCYSVLIMLREAGAQ
ncbi:hypothetical protein D0863_15313 [Hortaea werneckii]|uniref:C2H2-type domain-containing protein n=1 Tax=Hortaea werneckii TaxID=91943 RepID=A0A3M7CAR0_HORWE|nr:hypothetical protein D0863_15313 [Hortaea werneckii]